jgi:hypothetical protein
VALCSGPKSNPNKKPAETYSEVNKPRSRKPGSVESSPSSKGNLRANERMDTVFKGLTLAKMAENWKEIS